ncbi:hypothetical protein [Streptomyces sp. Je 1-369]|uniref:hypothetical protein n=1 Tax=Streptomyces sp. Je 1-369 TaxID=2966192 RepID=UPI002285CF41|nr:hypothetical protein [Streptomyces sp. Je 1-369]WAL98389.1 hypothetical protein NOO62_30235 [Streptomyces sp. Je 1-369]
MYALIVPASTPFVLLATIMGLAWWEDHVLPPAEADPAETPVGAPPPEVPAALPRPGARRAR